MKKSLFALIILNIFITTFSVSVFANSSGGHSFDNGTRLSSEILKQNFEEYKQNVRNNPDTDPMPIISDFIRGGGFIIDTLKFVNQTQADYIKQAFGLGSNASNSDINNHILDNVDDTGSDLIIDDSFNTQLVNISNNYKSNNEYYVGYTYDLNGNSQYFGARYQGLCDLVEEYQNQYICNVFGNSLYLIPKGYFFVYYNQSFPDDYFTTIFNIDNNNLATVTWNRAGNRLFNFDSSTGSYNEISTISQSTQIGGYLSKSLNNNVGYSNFYTGYQYIVTYNKREEFIVYKDTNSLLNNDGKAPYYYNNDVWEDFSSSVNGYTFSSSNTNTVSYSDVDNYANQYYDDHGYYPDLSTTNTYIDNSHNENISGGGSGGDDSGGGSGGDDEPTNIFDWLKNLGKVLGDLIRGIGNFLTEIIGGLVDAVTSLLSSISGLITGTLESLTNIFSGLISFVYSGLPTEVQSVMLLALSLALLVTVIDLFRK